MIKSIILLSSLFILTANADDDIALDVRASYLNYDYDKGFHDAEAFASSLKLKYSKELVENLEAGIAFGTIQDLGIGDKSKRDMAFMFNRNKESFTTLQQAYLKYKYSKSYIRAGRIEVETPLVSADDYFILASSYQGTEASIKEIKNIEIQIGYLSQMSGSWDSAYDGENFYSMTRQAWAHRADSGSEHYYNLVYDLGAKEAGLAFIGAKYEDNTMAVQLYDHVLLDVYNTFFTQIDYKTDIERTKLLLAGQFIKYNGIGSMKNNPNPDAVVDYSTHSAKAELSYNNACFKLAYTGISDTPSIHFFGAFGSYAEFASGMITSYFETSLRDANIVSLTPSYDFKFNKHSLNLNATYAYYDLNSDYTKGGILGDTTNGEEYMHAYGIGTTYGYEKNFSWNFKLAQRKLESEDTNLLFKTLLKYSF